MSRMDSECQLGIAQEVNRLVMSLANAEWRCRVQFVLLSCTAVFC